MTRGVGLRLAVASALLPLFLLTGCEPRAPLPDDLLVIGNSAEPRSLDPHVATATSDFRIAANLYEGLVRFRDGTLEIQPALAEEYEVSEDGKTYTFRLREGIRFHDGAVLDAEAVRFNFERMLDEEHPFRETGPFPLAFFFQNIESIETPDETTVIFHLDEPFAPFLSNLAYPTGFLVSPESVKLHGKGYGRNPSGTGPFRFVDWESNRVVRLERNEDYWGGAPRLRKVLFRPLPDENARLTELLAGGCDLAVEVPPDVIAWFRDRAGFQVLETPGPHLWFLILNTKEGPFQDERVRRAANLAIDRGGMIRELLQNTATEAAGPIPEAFDWAVGDAGVEPYPFDPEEARRLIREAGYEGAEIRLLATEGGSGMLAPREMAAAIQADLARVGLVVRIETFEWNSFLHRVNSGLEGRGDMAQMAWMVNDPDTLPFLALRTDAHPKKGGFNSGYYSNPEVDEWIEKGRRATSREERAEAYREVQRRVWEDAPWVFVASWKQNAVASDRVRGLELQPSFLLLLDPVWKEEVE